MRCSCSEMMRHGAWPQQNRIRLGWLTAIEQWPQQEHSPENKGYGWERKIEKRREEVLKTSELCRAGCSIDYPMIQKTLKPMRTQNRETQAELTPQRAKEILLEGNKRSLFCERK